MSFFLRTAAWAAACSISLSSSGCTLIGAGIGASIPRASDVETPLQIEAVPRGSEVTVVYYRPVDDRGGGHMQISGTYRGTDDGRAVVERGDKSFLIPLSRIEDTRARVPTSSYVTEGALVGGAIDLSLVILGVWMLAHYQPGYD
jgi:hypothetical protein